MSLFIAFFMSIAVNLDNFAIGMQLGIRKKSIPVKYNMIISSISGLIAAATAGMSLVFPDRLTSAAGTAGAWLILIFGIYCLLKRTPKASDSKQLSVLSPKAAFALGLMLAVNVIPPALGAGILGIPWFYMGIFCALCSFICMHISSRLGTRLKTAQTGACLDQVSALLLILIGLIELVI